MKIFAAAATLSMSVFLTACVTSVYDLSPEERATHYAKKAQSAILKGDRAEVAFLANRAMGHPTGNVKIQELFVSHPKGRDYYFSYLEQSITEISTTSQADEILNELTKLRSTGILSEAQISELFKKLSKKVADGNTNGSIPFDLSDKTDSFPQLQKHEHQRIMFDRTVKRLQQRSRSAAPLVGSLMEYVQRAEIKPEEKKRIEALLPTMNIKRDELDLVAKVFPSFTEGRLEEITTQVFLQVKNGDRLLTEDIRQVLDNRVRGVEWSTSTSPKTTTLIIEQLRNNERVFPERSQTITYAQSEVNILEAALLMPRNASYMYEVITGGAEIEYAYVVSAVADGSTIYDEVIRGKVGGEYSRCENPRIHNVFGGVNVAGFIANDDMQRRCATSSTIEIVELREEVFSKIADEVLKIPSIKKTHEFN